MGGGGIVREGETAQFDHTAPSGGKKRLGKREKKGGGKTCKYHLMHREWKYLGGKSIILPSRTGKEEAFDQC